ncbi:MAG: hypothetical protein PHV34_11775 [Verrucomicrobiae bacterium]|nr:hypothetical protein [Verrucomicrobiae bacterium]
MKEQIRLGLVGYGHRGEHMFKLAALCRLAKPACVAEATPSRRRPAGGILTRLHALPANPCPLQRRES